MNVFGIHFIQIMLNNDVDNDAFMVSPVAGLITNIMTQKRNRSYFWAYYDPITHIGTPGFVYRSSPDMPETVMRTCC